MPRRDALALPEVLLGFAAVLGAAAGSVFGFMKAGVLGAVVGVPVGALAGAAAALVVCILLAAVVFLAVVVWAFFRGGPRGVRELFRDAPASSTTAGESHGNG